MTHTLILGGTAWLGREIAQQFIKAGDDVTCLARGESGSVASGATLLRSDRRTSDAYGAVKHRNWDDIIELSCDAGLVGGALAALAETTPHWTLVSSVSVYAGNDEADADENADLVEPTDLTEYAHAKVAAERVTSQAVGDRLLIARPGLIVGPGDTSDRFSYWMSRLALALHKPVLVPNPHGRAAQFIDVRDLAAWIVAAGHRGLTGTYNAVGTKRELADLLATAQQVAGHDGDLISADDDWLIAHDVNYWAGPHSLPLWLPRSADGFFRRSRERFLESGGTERSLHETLSDVLADERARGLNRERRAGLTREDELRLLDELSNS